MPVRAVYWGRAWAFFCLLFVFFAARGSQVWAQIINARPTTAAAAVKLDYIFQAPELSSLKRIFPSPVSSLPSKIALSYYHPLIQICTYSEQHAGPSRYLILPGNRCFKADMLLAVHIGDEKRLLLPRIEGPMLTVVVRPGRIQEEWIWPDGIVLRRVCFQSPQYMGTGIRCVIHNQSASARNGLRLAMYLYDPEITACHALSDSGEADDEIFADPRTAALYQRDYLTREESWIGMGWGPEGGLITAGEQSGDVDTLAHRFNQPVAGITGMKISLETPAQDLLPGQFCAATFWTTWGNDRESVVCSLRQLRKASGYREWEEYVHAYNTCGMRFSCNNAELAYFFQSLKAWSPWMIRKDPSDQSCLTSLVDTNPVLPEQAVRGIEGLLAFQQRQEIRCYLDYWLDQRSETPAVAYTVILACRYLFLTQDKQWFKDNTIRLRELIKYLADMDPDGDGLPDYHLPVNYYSGTAENSVYTQKYQFLIHAIAGIRAFHSAAYLLNSLGNNEQKALAKEYQCLAVRAENALADHFWRQQSGSPGYYAAARLPIQGSQLPYQSANAIEIVRHKLGDTDKQSAVFQELWTNSAWRTASERYRLYLNQDTEYAGNILLNQKQVDFPLTHAILLAGLLNPQTASEAVERLLIYAKGVVTDPAVLAMPGKQNHNVTAIDIASLNLIELITRGLCGLEPVPTGLRVNLPLYKQDLAVEIHDLPYRNATVDVRVYGHGGGKGTIIVNGRKIKPGAVISNKVLSQGRVSIEIRRSSLLKKRKTIHPKIKKNPKKKRKRKR